MPKETFRGAVQVTTDVDMDKLLAKLPQDLRRKAARDAVKANVMAVARDYKGRIPRGPTGNLKNSVKWKVIEYRSGTIWYGLAGHIKPTGNHAHLINLGHNVYSRGPKNESLAKREVRPKSGTARVAGKRYLHKAIISTRKKRDKIVVDSLKKSIEKAGG